MNEKLRTLVQALTDEINEAKGAKSYIPPRKEWWRSLDWKSPEYRTIYDTLGEDTRKQIIEAGLCPDCPSEEDAPEEQCPEGMKWSMEKHVCVPMDEEEEKEEEEDVLESNPGFSPGEAEHECPEGMEWNAEKKQCVEIANFDSKKDAEKKVDPIAVLDRFNKVMSRS